MAEKSSQPNREDKQKIKKPTQIKATFLRLERKLPARKKIITAG